jgi:drug/metabolite transporter (DMT)-like permease
VERKSNESGKPQFQPLAVMGVFWMAFGAIILLSSFFVRETPRVPLIRGLVTNIIAAVLLLGAGFYSWIRARRQK